MDNQHLIACLILHQQQKDNALGIGWQSSKLRGLTWYYDTTNQKQRSQFTIATIVNSFIQSRIIIIQSLMNQMNESDDKATIAKKIIDIGHKIDLAKQVLDELTSDNQKIDTENN